MGRHQAIGGARCASYRVSRGLRRVFGCSAQAGGRRADSRKIFCGAGKEIGAYLDTARPTAVNLHWAVVRMGQRAEQLALEPHAAAELVQGLWQECQQMLAEDVAACRAIGEYGADLLEQILIFRLC